MSDHIPKHIRDFMLSDDTFWLHINRNERDFKAGDRSALLDAIVTCAKFQAVMPDWVVDEMIQLEGWIDLNDFFGRALPSVKEKAECRRDSIELDVIEALLKHRKNGGNWNIDESLGSIAIDLDVSRRDVEEIYKFHKDTWLKGLSQGFGISELESAPVPPRFRQRVRQQRIHHEARRLRRTGRSILFESGSWKIK